MFSHYTVGFLTLRLFNDRKEIAVSTTVITVIFAAINVSIKVRASEARWLNLKLGGRL